mgnify:CR=1 FL=1
MDALRARYLSSRWLIIITAMLLIVMVGAWLSVIKITPDSDQYVLMAQGRIGEVERVALHQQLQQPVALGFGVTFLLRHLRLPSTRAQASLPPAVLAAARSAAPAARHRWLLAAGYAPRG